MDKDTPPSVPMIKKLMKVQGLDRELDKVFHNAAYLLTLSYLNWTSAEYQKYADLHAKDIDVAEIIAQTTQEAYGRHLSADDVLELIAFAKTDAGQKLMKCENALRKDLFDSITTLSMGMAIDMIKKAANGEIPPEVFKK
jgi:hypothetical protein